MVDEHAFLGSPDIDTEGALKGNTLSLGTPVDLADLEGTDDRTIAALIRSARDNGLDLIKMRYLGTPVDQDDADRFEILGPPAKDAGEEAQSKMVEFKRIGLDRPLTISIASVYAGKVEGNPSLLVMSAVKDSSFDAPGVLAMHWWLKEVDSQSFVPVDDAGIRGSRIVYYSPAVSEFSLSVSVKLKFDRFDEASWNEWANVAADTLSLPAFLGGAAVGGGAGGAAAQALISASKSAAKVAVSLIDRHLDGEDPISLNWSLSIDDPGTWPGEAGYVLLTKSDQTVNVHRDRPATAPANGYVTLPETCDTTTYLEVKGSDYDVDGAGVLRHRADGTWPDGTAYRKGDQVRGPFPYALIKLDGRERANLKKWKPTALTAEAAARFLNRSRESLAKQIGETLEEVGDLTLLRQAADLDSAIESAESRTKAAALKKQQDALIDAVQDDALKKLARKEHASNS